MLEQFARHMFHTLIFSVHLHYPQLRFQFQLLMLLNKNHPASYTECASVCYLEALLGLVKVH